MPQITRFVFVLCFMACFLVCMLLHEHAWAVTELDSKAFGSLNQAVRSAGNTPVVLRISSPLKVTTSMLVPAAITLQFNEGASLLIDKGAAVTIESAINAAPRKIFDGPGKVVLKNGQAFPQWWGAAGNGSVDDGYAIQESIDALYAGGGGTLCLPAGTYLLNHVTGGYYALKSRDRVSVVGNGKSSVILVGNALRNATHGVAVLYNHDEPVTSCRFAAFTINYNGQENLRLSAWGGKAYASNVSRLGADLASNLIIENLLFENVSGAHCVYIGNNPQNHNNTVRNCEFRNVGQSVAGNQLTDHSSIYVGGTKAVITGNKFVNDSPCNISTAIEVHSSDTLVSGNSVINYSIGVNVGGEANDCAHVIFNNNQFEKCRYGFVLWHYSPFKMNDIIISNNSISIRESYPPYPQSIGIVYGSGFATSKKNMHGLTIENNRISLVAPITLTGSPICAINLESIDDVIIRNNTILHFTGEAILLQVRSKEQSMRNIAISKNTIEDAGGTSTLNRKRAIAFNAYNNEEGSIRDVNIEHNIVTGSSSDTARSGITFNSGLFSNISIRDNQISGVAAAELSNYSSDKASSFKIDHKGAGYPSNKLRAVDGSRWTDAKTGTMFVNERGLWK